MLTAADARLLTDKNIADGVAEATKKANNLLPWAIEQITEAAKHGLHYTELTGVGDTLVALSLGQQLQKLGYHTKSTYNVVRVGWKTITE